jgi:hypothetical protein
LVNRAVSEDPLLGELRRQPGQRSHLVERIRHDDDHCVGRVLRDVLGHTPHDLGVDLEQVHTAHAGLARQAGRDDDDVGVGCRLVAATVRRGGRADDGRFEALDRARLVEVERESLGLALDDVGQHDGLEDVVLGQTLSRRGPVEAGSHDGDLAATRGVGHSDLLRLTRGNRASAPRLFPGTVVGQPLSSAAGCRR